MTWTAPLPAGFRSLSESVELTGFPTPLYDVFVTVDGGNDARTSAIDECYEDNNETNWGEVLCY